jgi:uncharacterized membrane protein HdeD (DUF308 family)
MDAPLLRRVWWVLVVRGVLGVLFGILAFAYPGTTLAVLIAFFGAYALIDGILALYFAARAPREHVQIWPFVVEGIVGILAGIGAFVAPLVTAIALETLVAAWMFVTGVFELIAAFRLRHAISGEWILAVTGILSIIAGLALWVWPVAGLAAIVVVIGAYALVFGLLLISLGLRVRAWSARPTAPAAA